MKKNILLGGDQPSEGNYLKKILSLYRDLPKKVVVSSFLACLYEVQEELLYYPRRWRRRGRWR